MPKTKRKRRKNRRHSPETPPWQVALTAVLDSYSGSQRTLEVPSIHEYTQNQELFAHFDVDGDRDLKLDEFGAFLHQLDSEHAWPAEDIVGLLRESDEDGDWAISFGEFKTQKDVGVVFKC